MIVTLVNELSIRANYLTISLIFIRGLLSHDTTYVRSV